jgi:hypothetical protein
VPSPRLPELPHHPASSDPSEGKPPGNLAYTPDRKGIHPQQHLESFNGTLQADSYGDVLRRRLIGSSTSNGHVRCIAAAVLPAGGRSQNCSRP